MRERVEQDQQLDDVLRQRGADVCTTNTSSSRTFSSIRTLRFSFEKRVVESRPGAMPRHLQIAWASAGATIRKDLEPSISAAILLPFMDGSSGAR